MFNPTKLDLIIHRIGELVRRFSSPIHRCFLRNKDFTIISNNCWGGICYEYFGMQKLSPTIGTFFFAEDYLKLVKNLRYYLDLSIRFIPLEQSKHKESLKKMQISCPIGLLDDVEVFFLHYANDHIAQTKWNRRLARVNWDNLIFKFSFMNECTYNHLKEFDEACLPGKKIMFVNKKNLDFSCSVYYPGFEEDAQIENDTFYWNRYFDVVKFLNSKI